jgi:hypothetical protein
MFLLNDEKALTLFDSFTQGVMPQARRYQVHNQRLPLLQPGAGLQRRGCRGYRARAGEGLQDWLDEHEPKLGSKLAVKRSVGGTTIVVQGHGERQAHLNLVEHSPSQLAVRSNFHREKL